jgi:ribonuclease VapC
VLDSFALLCYLNREPGFAQVTTKLAAASKGQSEIYLSMVNFGEVLYITEHQRGLTAAQLVLQAIDQLPLILLDATRDRILAAAHIKANHAISYADAFVVAAAQEFAATVLTGDPEFARVEHLITVEWMPQS